MFDIQKMMDAMSNAARHERGRYHVTLGDLTEAVKGMPSYGRVRLKDGSGICDEHSYRGYYSDLAFEWQKEPTPKDEAVAMLQRASENTYEGYKGGNYRYAADTPLWCASYGCCGSAITHLEDVDGDIVLTLTNVE